MKIVYASRTGNVQSIIDRLKVNDTLQIETGNETVNENFILFTYTDGYGDTPSEVIDFVSNHSDKIKAVIVSGDKGYGETYCQAGDNISKEFDVPCLYKVENDGTEQDIKAIKNAISPY